MNRRRHTAVLVLVVAIAAAIATMATAAAPVKVPAGFQLTPIGRLPFPERGYVVDLPKSASVHERQVHVTENGLGIGDFTFQALSASGVRYGAILAIDASDSMAGKPEKAAVDAARTFVARRGPNEQIGVVTFNSTVNILTKPTVDGGHVGGVLARRPVLAYGTHIYDALQSSLGLLARQRIAAGAIVLLSDGADVGSRSSLRQVVQAARKQHVRIFTIGLHSGAFDGTILRAIATQTSGSYAEATAAQLDPVYGALSERIANEYLLQYRSAAAPKSNVTVTVNIDGLGRGATSYTAPTPSDLPPFHRPFFRTLILSWFSLLIVALIAAWLFSFAVKTLLESSRSHVVERVGAFAGEPTTTKQKADEVEEWRRRARRARTSGSAVARGWVGRLEEQLDIGRIHIPAARVILLTGLATGLAIVILSMISPVFMLAGFGTPLVTRGMIRRKVAAVRNAFADQLPPNLQVLASALRAGHTLVGALSTTVEHADEPSKTEFQRILSDEQLGVPLEDAVRVGARRMASRDLEQVALLAELQRSAGGNAAEVLDVIVVTVRERADVRRLVKTLTAQGRMARWILTALPIATALAFWAIQPDIVGGFWRSHGGQVALLIAAVMVAGGSMVIQRIIDIEV